MTSRIALAAFVFLPVLASAQTVPVTHTSSGLTTTASVFHIERDGPRSSGPRGEATGMNAPSALEAIPLRRRPGGRGGPATQPARLIKRVQPAFRMTSGDTEIPNVQDVLFFTESRVVRIQLRLDAAGGSLSSAWVAQLRRYFDFLDRDNDGYLNAFEADFVFSNTGLQKMMLVGFTYINQAEPGRTLADFDRDEDGRISFDEFAAYYAPSMNQLLRIVPNSNRDVLAERMTEACFKLLDRDGDGRLSKSELIDAEKLIPLLDQNEDECLSALEILPNLYSQPSANPKNASPSSEPLPKSPRVALHPSAEPLRFYRTGAIPDSIAEQILAVYDKDANQRLSQAESGFDNATFKALDANGDGQLTVAELKAWKNLPPDISLELTIGRTQSECVIKMAPPSNGKPGRLSGAVSASDNGLAYVHVGKQQLDLRVFSEASPSNAVNQNFLNIFNQADPDNRGFITENDLAGPQFQFLRVLFDVVDRDGDGKMTKAEFVKYFEMQGAFTSLPLMLTHLTQIPSLFSLLDADRDGRLSVRELRNSWNRLKDLEATGDPYITRSAIRPHAAVRFFRASQSNLALAGANYNLNIQPLTKGPLWFQKMDRNSDGDVSRKEFPGRSDEFNKLDLDHDGLISLDEATAAEKKYRKAKMEKK